jgi:hypothetical protein
MAQNYAQTQQRHEHHNLYDKQTICVVSCYAVLQQQIIHRVEVRGHGRWFYQNKPRLVPLKKYGKEALKTVAKYCTYRLSQGNKQQEGRKPHRAKNHKPRTYKNKTLQQYS